MKLLRPHCKGFQSQGLYKGVYSQSSLQEFHRDGTKHVGSMNRGRGLRLQGLGFRVLGFSGLGFRIYVLELFKRCARMWIVFYQKYWL